MERYGKEARCPKCGGSLSARRYNAVSDMLEAKCWNCGYQQDMLPLDREEKPHVCGECRYWSGCPLPGPACERFEPAGKGE